LWQYYWQPYNRNVCNWKEFSEKVESLLKLAQLKEEELAFAHLTNLYQLRRKDYLGLEQN